MSLTIKHISYLSKLDRFDNKFDAGLITYFYQGSQFRTVPVSTVGIYHTGQ